MAVGAWLDERVVDEALRAWPGLDVEPAAFLAYLRERSDPEGSGPLQIADLYLAFACASGDARALSEFESRYISQVPRFVARVEREEHAVEEVKQLVRERLFMASPEGARPKILEYSGRGSLASWVRVVALRVASNRRRAQLDHRHAPFDDEADAPDLLPAVDPELGIIKARYATEFNEALRGAFAELAPRERLVFRMHFVDGVNIDGIGTVFQVHRATVARWIAAAREQLVERTMALMGERLRLTPTEVASLLRVVRSSLDMSLQAVLREA